MFKDGGKAQRNAAGETTKAAPYQSRETPKARIEPNRKWFGNTRVISQEALSSFREAVSERASDPYQVLLKTNKLPMSLIRDGQDGNSVNGLKQHQAKVAVEAAPFADTFGPKAQRKRVKLSAGTMEDLAGEADKMHDTYLDRLEQAKLLSGNSGETTGENVNDKPLTTAREPVFSKGQSKRIWNELYKVIDSSDVVIHVLDARDPEGTRCRSIEKYIREEAPHKHLVFVLNKCDLVPTGVAVSFRLHFVLICPFSFSFWCHRFSQDSFQYMYVLLSMEGCLLRPWQINLPATCASFRSYGSTCDRLESIVSRVWRVLFRVEFCCHIYCGVIAVLLVTSHTTFVSIVLRY